MRRWLATIARLARRRAAGDEPEEAARLALRWVLARPAIAIDDCNFASVSDEARAWRRAVDGREVRR